MKKYENSFTLSMNSQEEFFDFIKGVKKEWLVVPVAAARYLPAVYVEDNEYAPSVSEDARKDAFLNREMAVIIDGKAYPIRYDPCAQKTLLERNKMTGKAMSDMGVARRCECLNFAKELYPKDLMKVLIQEDKASAFLSGGERDYAILDAYELMEAIQSELDDRFDGAQFAGGYFDHTRTSARWVMPKQADELVGKYLNFLRSIGRNHDADRLFPGITFSTSDIGIGKASVSAYLYGLDRPICIGSALEVKHRSGATVADFVAEINGMFAMFNDFTEALERLWKINISYPLDTMKAVCKKLMLPKKASLDAIDLFESINGKAPCTAADVYIAMQEILDPKINNQFRVEENLAKALAKKFDWQSYDRPGVEW